VAVAVAVAVTVATEVVVKQLLFNGSRSAWLDRLRTEPQLIPFSSSSVVVVVVSVKKVLLSEESPS